MPFCAFYTVTVSHCSVSITGGLLARTFIMIIIVIIVAKHTQMYVKQTMGSQFESSSSINYVKSRVNQFKFA